MPVIGQVWRNFSGFWKSQLFWSVVVAVITAGWQYHKGLLPGSIRNNLWAILIPYIAIASLLLALNMGHAIFRAEWNSFKKRQHNERRAERKAETEHSKAPIHKPNIQFRRIFEDTKWFGHEIGGHSAEVMLVEVGNELADRPVGNAKNLRAHITYLDSTDNKLQIRCPGSWTTEQNEINIPAGESRLLLVAVLKGAVWVTDLYNGIPLQNQVNVEIRLLDRDGQLSSDTVFIQMHFGNQRYPACKWIQAAS